MVEFLMVMAQGLCILALLGGTYFSITRKREPASIRTEERYDPVTAHTWQARQDRVRRHG